MRQKQIRAVNRTIRHGHRLTPQHRIVESLKVPAEEALRKVKKILANNQSLSKRELFLLKQMAIAAQRQILPKGLERKKEELRSLLEEREDEGIKLGFSVEEIRGMNAAVFLIDNEGWLVNFLEEAQKIIQKTEEAKN